MTSAAPTPTPVVSSVLVSVTYAADGTLDLVFRSGARLCYFAVPLPAPPRGPDSVPSRYPTRSRNRTCHVPVRPDISRTTNRQGTNRQGTNY